MSSIYDALERVQRKDSDLLEGVTQISLSSRWHTWVVVFIAVLISSGLTWGVFCALSSGQADRVTGDTALSQTKPPPAVADVPGQTVSPDVPAMAVETTLRHAGDCDPAPAEPVPVDPEPVKGVPSGHGFADYADCVPADAGQTASDPGYYIELGSRYFDKGDYEGALGVYTQALESFGDDFRILNNMGSVLLARGEPQQAIVFFLRAHDLFDDSAEPVYNMACAYAKTGQDILAMDALAKALDMNSEVRTWAAHDPDLMRLKGKKAFDVLITRGKDE
ncbi:MAG: tetratricopeptide repeat protein [Thermodesulfobacteriota bacterium]|nr:tetratricopeptide repeat protein [Thermodesulfobacteriota bacterium]